MTKERYHEILVNGIMRVDENGKPCKFDDYELNQLQENEFMERNDIEEIEIRTYEINVFRRG